MGIILLSFLSFYNAACSQKKLLTYPDEKQFFHCVDFYQAACSQKKLLTYPDEKLFFNGVDPPFLMGILVMREKVIPLSYDLGLVATKPVFGVQTKRDSNKSHQLQILARKLKFCP